MTLKLLAESRLLHEALHDILDGTSPYPGARFSVAMNACEIAFEHATGLRTLIQAGLSASATALLRVQFEALTRAMWLLYAASETDIETLQGPLNLDTQKAANKLPMLVEMLKALKKVAPPTAIRPLLQFKELSAGPMNSFVHSGVHPLQRNRQGFPALLLDQVVRSSNGLNTMCGMLIAILAGDSTRVARMRDVQRRFADVLPPMAQEP